MNIQRFHAPTAREALAKARMTFGDGTLILSNRPTATGVEVLAAAEDSLAALTPPQPRMAAAKSPSAPARPQAAAAAPASRSQVEEDADQLAMSTLSFQDYVRERMLRRRHEELNFRAATPPASKLSASASDDFAAARQSANPAPAQPAGAVRTSATPSRASASAPASQDIADELHAMKELIEERFNTLSWLGQAQQDPIKSQLMLKLIRSGYSPALARSIMDKLPAKASPAESLHWVMDVLERNLKTDAARLALHEEGGIYALVGATGVGKTTTAAKLAALCARLHGPESVGLITLDTYRIGAHEQLRNYGRMLGVVAHLAHDKAALQDLLGLLSAKKMILVDTTGVAPRDPRKRELLEVLDLPRVNRLLVLNAAGQGDTLDEVVACFRGAGVQQTVLTKLDEAVKLGPVLDTAIRNQLLLRGVTNGQRVPEDWERAHAANLIRLSMRTPAKSAHAASASDLGFFFTAGADAAAGRLHV
jgi:flagellar biosynthesis protein FlhF